MKERKPTITVLLDKNAIVRIDKMAEKMGLSRSKVASNLLSSGLVVVEAFDDSGLLLVGNWLENIIERVKAHDSAVEKQNPAIERTTLTVTIPLQEVEYLGKLAEQFFNTRAKIAGNIIVANLPTLEVLAKLGLVEMAAYFRELKAKAAKILNAGVKTKAKPGLETI